MEKNKIKLVILGAGYGFSEVLGLINDVGGYNIVGILDDDESKHKTKIEGHEVLGPLMDYALLEKNIKFVLAIGNFQNRFQRKEILSRLNITPERFISLIHPSVIVYNSVKIGFGCILHPGCIIHPLTVISNFVVISAGTIIGVQNHISEHTLIAGRVVTATNIKFGTCSFIGTGVIIAPDITLGTGSMAAVGSVVFKSIDRGHCVIGNPARTYKKVDVPEYLNPQPFE